MLAPLSWIKEYISTKSSAEALAEKLLLSGTKVEEVKKSGKEIVFDLEITPNRPDTLSMLGVAREVAAIEGKDIVLPETELIIPQKPISTKVDFVVKNKKLCPNYSIVRLKNIEVSLSPDWLKNFLQLAGVRPINNIVDITNFVMLETGQPMHAFDSSKIKGQIVLRGARANEKVETLDGQLRVVPEGAILIEDEEKVIDLAGLMGGKNSEIDSKTTEIVLHVPIYDPVTIRKTSLFTNLRTEASNRFEKKLDPNMHAFAINRAIKLFSELGGGVLGSRITSTPKVDPKHILFPRKLILQIIGIELTDSEVIDILSSAGFIVRNSPNTEDEFDVQIPTYRTDISITEDLVEEIARLYGYNNLPKTLPIGQTAIEPLPTESQTELREFLLRNKFNESTGYTLISKQDLADFGIEPEKTLKVRNPASSDFEYLRPTLLINLVKAVALNSDQENLRFFEIAKVFEKNIDQRTKLPWQTESLGFIFQGDILGFKSVVSELFSKLDFKFEEREDSTSNLFDKKIELLLNQKKIGEYGTLSKVVLKKYELDQSDIFGLEIDLEALRNLKQIVYEPLAKFPSVKEDVSFYLDSKHSIGRVINQIKELQNLHSVVLTDVFTNKNGRSITLSLEYLDQAKTLQLTEIEKIRSSVVRVLEKKFNASIRKE